MTKERFTPNCFKERAIQYLKAQKTFEAEALMESASRPGGGNDGV